jgi:hypothetical protein
MPRTARPKPPSGPQQLILNIMAQPGGRLRFRRGWASYFASCKPPATADTYIDGISLPSVTRLLEAGWIVEDERVCSGPPAYLDEEYVYRLSAEGRALARSFLNVHPPCDEPAAVPGAGFLVARAAYEAAELAGDASPANPSFAAAPVTARGAETTSLLQGGATHASL